MIRRTLVLTTVLLALASSVQAQAYRPTTLSRAEKWEFSIQTRYVPAKEFSGEGGSSVKLNEDLGWGFGFAYNLNQHWSLGFGFSWRSVPYTATIVDGDDPQTTSDYASDMDFSTFGFSGMWNVFKGQITPYVNGNLGWTLINSNIYAGSVPGCWWDPWWGYICGSVPTTYGKTITTYSAGLGLRADMGEAFFLRGGYEYARDNAGAVEATSMIRVDIGWTF